MGSKQSSPPRVSQPSFLSESGSGDGARRPEAATSGTRIRPGRVLVIDDEALLGQALQRALGDDNQTVAVTDASEALTRLQRGERYDVVLCDVMMPTMDGIDFHQRLQAVLPYEADRVVFMTGGAITGRVEAFFNRVSNLLLEKPINLDGLSALIERRIRGEVDRASSSSNDRG